MSETKRKSGLFAKIETRDDAQKTIRDAAYAFFFVAGLQALVAVLTGARTFFDAIVLAVLATLLLKRQSRAAAILLLLLSSLQAVVTLLNRLGLMAAGGTNVILAAIMLIVAVRAVQATFKVRKLSTDTAVVT